MSQMALAGITDVWLVAAGDATADDAALEE